MDSQLELVLRVSGTLIIYLSILIMKYLQYDYYILSYSLYSSRMHIIMSQLGILKRPKT